ncbi:uncharacterized protein TrAtP1_007369 [Trichoderma atroviride]|uniref:uncharacterized protein n=1 Tax=Hypocrea atroviridis TaxID=63577 RepID=UPI00332A3140|nr:hypothetical protein TrAtP1_007369 [Trichoderma atroviride]
MDVHLSTHGQHRYFLSRPLLFYLLLQSFSYRQPLPLVLLQAQWDHFNSDRIFAEKLIYHIFNCTWPCYQP